MPLSNRLAHSAQDTTEIRSFAVFPHQGQGQSNSLLFDDDGTSYGYQQDAALWLTMSLNTSPDRLDLFTTRKGHFQPVWERITFQLPDGEQRPLFVNGHRVHCNEELPSSLLWGAPRAGFI